MRMSGAPPASSSAATPKDLTLALLRDLGAAGLLGASSIGGGAILTSLTSLLLRDHATPERLLLCLLVCELLALAAALYVGHIDRLERAAAAKT